MAITARPGQYSDVTLAPVDRKGNPAVVDGVTFTSSNSEVVEVIQDENDKLKARINYRGVGTAQIDVVVDAELGDGERTISDFVAVEVRPEEAVGLGLQISEPADVQAEAGE